MSKEKLVYQPDPVQTVEKAITHIWLHPLLDQQTIKHRSQMVDTFNQAFRELTQRNDATRLVNPDSFVAAPIGSCIWNTTPDSDTDWMLYSDDTEQLGHLRNAILISQGRILKHLSDARKVQIVGPFDSQDSQAMLTERGLATPLLWTPDVYLGGSIKLAHTIRQNLTTKLGLVDEELRDVIWSDPNYGALLEFFNIRFRSWGTEEIEFEEAQRKKLGLTSKFLQRKHRFESALSSRSVLARNPEYSQDFLKALENFTLPNFNTYAQAITQTKGALNLDLHYGAENIVES